MNNPSRLRHLKTFTAVSSGLVLVLGSGCLIVPIPHSRTWAPAREGLVVNAKTGAPVANAQVSSLHDKGGSTRTDGKGHFRLSPAKSWHGAYLCAIPLSFSLFPTLDMPRRTGQGVSVSAAGFETYDESHLPSIENEWWPPVLPGTISLDPAVANHPPPVPDTSPALAPMVFGALPAWELSCKAMRFTRQTGLMGLRWLKAVQNEDGSWPENKIAMTAMALCAFMAEGHKPGASPEFGETMVKGAEFLISHQRQDGLFDIRDQENFSHPIATWALFSLYGMTLNPNVRAAAEKALKPIRASQSATGGWAPAMARQGDDDTAYTYWCLEALRAARAADIPRIHEDLDDAIARATEAFGRLDHLQADSWIPRWDGPTPGQSRNPSKSNVHKARLSSDAAPFATQFDQFRVERILWEAHGEPYIKWIQPAVALYAAAQFVTPSNETASVSCPCKDWNPKGPCSRLSNPYRDEEGTPRAIGHWINDDIFGDSPVMDTCLVLIQICKPISYLPRFPKPKGQPIVPETEDDRDIAVDTDL